MVVFALAGTALVGISTQLESNEPLVAKILFTLGLSVAAIAVTTLLWGIAGGNPIEHQISDLRDEISRLSTAVDIIKQSASVGLRAVHARQSEFSADKWTDLLASSKSQVDLMGRTLFNWTTADEVESLIAKKVSEGVTFRWLIMSKDNVYLKELREDSVMIMGLLEPKLDPVYKFLSSIRARLPKAQQGRFRVKRFKNVPLYATVSRVDEEFFAVPYFTCTGPANSPMLVVHSHRSVWGALLSREFESIWNDPGSTDLFEAPAGEQAAE